jgi:hypothetical protein
MIISNDDDDGDNDDDDDIDDGIDGDSCFDVLHLHTTCFICMSLL